MRRRSTDSGENLYVISFSSPAYREARRKNLYYIEDKGGENYLPVFTTPESADEFVQARSATPEAHARMLESLRTVTESSSPSDG